VTAQQPRGRKAAAWVDDGSPSDPEMRAWLLRAMQGRGPAG